MNEDQNQKQSDVAFAFKAGQESCAGHPIVNGQNGTAVSVIVPKWGDLKPLSTEADSDNPRRKRAKVTVNDVDSFCAYVNQHKLPSTVVFGDFNGDASERMLHARIDYHEKESPSTDAIHEGENGAPNWGEHHVNCAMPFAREWETWNKHAGHEFSQVEFAEFIEDNLDDIIEPLAADLIEMAKFFQATSSATFRSRIDTRTGGIQFNYEEDVQESAGRNIAQSRPFPSQMILGIPVFQGGQAYRIQANLRYRLNSGRLKLIYSIPAQVCRGRRERGAGQDRSGDRH